MNMSYCRFENTARDLDDCQEAFERFMDGDEEDKGDGSALSEREVEAAKRLLSTCLDIVQIVADELCTDSLGDIDEEKIRQMVDLYQGANKKIDQKRKEKEEE